MPGYDDIVYGLGAVLYLIAFYNCYRLLTDRLSPAATTAWILINILLPVVGVPLYFLLGHARIRGYVRKRHRTLDHHLVGKRDPSDVALKAERHAEFGPQFEDFTRIFSSLGHTFMPHLSDVKPLIDGVNTFEAIFKAIKEARHYILVQYYILKHDRLGLELKGLLIEKTRAGIPVFLLYDDMGSLWLSRKYVRDLREAGVEVARFLPVTSLSRFFQMNFRNHRKLVIVDGHSAFTGGLNVGEEYATRYFRREETKRRPWRDTHVMVTGEAVQRLEENFIDDWTFATDLKPGIPSIEQAVVAEPSGKTAVQVIPTGPADPEPVSILLYMLLLQTARHRLWLATPYFIPDATLTRALELAVLRGVDVRVLIPDESDYRFVHWVTLSYADHIQSLGVKVCLYKKGFMHQKAVLIDDHVTAVGTMNIDNRAFYLNFEMTLVMHSREFNREFAAILEKDFLEARYYQRESRPLLRQIIRLRAGFVRLLAPLL